MIIYKPFGHLIKSQLYCFFPFIASAGEFNMAVTAGALYERHLFHLGVFLFFKYIDGKKRKTVLFIQKIEAEKRALHQRMQSCITEVRDCYMKLDSHEPCAQKIIPCYFTQAAEGFL
jgi:hypothetical protein